MLVSLWNTGQSVPFEMRHFGANNQEKETMKKILGAVKKFFTSLVRRCNLESVKNEGDITRFRPRPVLITFGGQGIFNLFDDTEVSRVALAEESFLQKRLEGFLEEEGLSKTDFTELAALERKTDQHVSEMGRGKVFTFKGVYRNKPLAIEEILIGRPEPCDAVMAGKYGLCDLRTDQCAPILRKIKMVHELYRLLSDPAGMVRSEVDRLRDRHDQTKPSEKTPFEGTVALA